MVYPTGYGVFLFFHFLLLKAVLHFTFARRESVSYIKTGKQLTRLVFYYETKASNQGFQFICEDRWDMQKVRIFLRK